MFSDGDEILQSFLRILLLITHFQVLTVHSFITLISQCADRKLPQFSLSCRYDSECVQNAYCRDDSCHCIENFFLQRNRTHYKCLRVVQKIGDPCEENKQCQIAFGTQAECREKTCQCLEGSQFAEERCYEIKRLGEYCKTSRNCYVEGSEGFCISGRCTCPFFHHPSHNKTRCIKDVFLQGNCSIHEECIVENSKCMGKCRCDINHVTSSNDSVCLKIADEISEICEEDSQCQELKYSKCTRGKCSCIKGYHHRSSTCFLNVGLNEHCENHEQCITLTNVDSHTSAVTNVDCIGGVCTCSADHTLTSDGFDCIGYVENGVSTWRLSPIVLIVAAFIVVN